MVMIPYTKEKGNVYVFQGKDEAFVRTHIVPKIKEGVIEANAGLVRLYDIPFKGNLERTATVFRDGVMHSSCSFCLHHETNRLRSVLGGCPCPRVIDVQDGRRSRYTQPAVDSSKGIEEVPPKAFYRDAFPISIEGSERFDPFERTYRFRPELFPNILASIRTSPAGSLMFPYWPEYPSRFAETLYAFNYTREAGWLTVNLSVISSRFLRGSRYSITNHTKDLIFVRRIFHRMSDISHGIEPV